MGFNEEEIANGVSTLDAMFQQYVSQCPNYQHRVIRLSVNQDNINGDSEHLNNNPTSEQIVQHSSAAYRQNETIQELQPGHLTRSTCSLSYSRSNSVVPLEKTPEPITSDSLQL